MGGAGGTSSARRAPKGVSTRVIQVVPPRRGVCDSGEEFDALVGVEEHVNVGHPSMIRTTVRRALCTSRPRAWKIPQRSAFGRASRHVPEQHKSWNHRTRSAARTTVIIQVALAKIFFSVIRC